MQITTFTGMQARQFVETLNKLDAEHPYVVKDNKKNLFSANETRDGKLNRHQITDIAHQCLKIFRRLSLSETNQLLQTLSTGLENCKKVFFMRKQTNMPDNFEQILRNIYALLNGTAPLKTKEIAQTILTYLSSTDVLALSHISKQHPLSCYARKTLTEHHEKIKTMEMLAKDGASTNGTSPLTEEVEKLKKTPPDMQVKNCQKSVSGVKKLTWLKQPTVLPENISMYSNLETMFVDNGSLGRLPQSIGSLNKLSFLSLSNNKIESLPNSIGNLTQLGYLNLSGNPLKNLPESMANLKKLAILNLSHTALNNVTKQWIKNILPATCKVIFD